MAGTFDQGGARCICDGYRAIRIRAEAVQMPPHADPDAADTPIDLYPIFKGISDRPAVTLPPAEWLKAQIKIAKAESRSKGLKPSKITPIAKLGAAEGPVYVKADYLLDALESLPGHTAATAVKATSPIYIESPEGDAVIMTFRYADTEPTPQRPLIDCTTAEGRATA